jgi:hypothetical protein
MITLHRPDDDPTAEIYTFDRSALPTASKNPSLYPVPMAQFRLLPLEEDVQVDLDMRPDPPFPTAQGHAGNDLGPSKPFGDNPEEGVLVFNMTVMTATADDFTHVVIVASKAGMLQLARERYRSCLDRAEEYYLGQGVLIGNADYDLRRDFTLEWELWGSVYTRIFEDNTLGVNWVSLGRICRVSRGSVYKADTLIPCSFVDRSVSYTDIDTHASAEDPTNPSSAPD